MMTKEGFLQWLTALKNAKADSRLCEIGRKEGGIRKQIYAVVHDGQGNFIIAEKNLRGYFFHENLKTGEPVIVPLGQPQNGGGNMAFPGGAIMFDQDPALYEPPSILTALLIDGAVKEFFEETNVKLENENIKNLQGYDLKPPIFLGYYQGTLRYFGVYFHVHSTFFNKLYDTIQNNLTQGRGAADAVQNGFLGTYNQLRIQFLDCPLDNELNHIEIWNLNQMWPTIRGWRDDPDLGWYFEILDNLRRNPVPNVPLGENL